MYTFSVLQIKQPTHPLIINNKKAIDHFQFNELEPWWCVACAHQLNSPDRLVWINSPDDNAQVKVSVNELTMKH